MAKLWIAAALLLASVHQPHKSHVLIIGDSVSQGYTPYVRQALPCVEHTPGPNGSTKGILKHFDTYVSRSHYDVIYFNAGLWDISHRTPDGKLDKSLQSPITSTPDEYRANLEELLRRFKQHADVVIFATTTDVLPHSPGRDPADVAAYNAIALDVMQKNHIRVDDLNKWMQGRDDLHKLSDHKGVHYTNAGSRLLAKEVIDTLNSVLVCKN
jgi:lysophospholipase L1-like esterase